MNFFRKLRRMLGLSVQVTRLLRPHARGHGMLFLLGLVFSIVLLVLRLAQPWPLKWMIDLLAKTHHRVPMWVTSLPLLSAGYLGLTILAACFEYGQRMALVGLGNRIVYSFRRQLFAQVLRQPLTFHQRHGAGELLTRVVYDTSRLRRGVIAVLLRFYQSVLHFIFSVAVLLWLDSLLAAVLFVSGVAALTAMVFSGRRILSASRKSRKREGKLAGVVEENLRAVRELQTFTPEDMVDRRFSKQNERSLKGEQKVRRLEALLLLRVETLIAAGICGIMWLGADRIHSGALTPGDLVLFVNYALALYRPFSQFARQASQSGRTAACAERLVRVIEETPEISDGGIEAVGLSGEIAFEQVGLRGSDPQRGGREWVLEKVSFRTRVGERVALLGPNGAGKSTALQLLVRLQDPTSGKVLLDGRDVREYALASLRGQMSVVYQNAVFFGLSVRENVMLGRPMATDAEITAALDKASLTAFVQTLRYGEHTPLRQAGTTLSGGERQRLALARAFLRNGKIWLLDEPTTGLDATAKNDLRAALLEATKGRSTLWVTHDLDTAQQLDRIVLLGEGQVRFDGTPAEFRDAGKDREYLSILSKEE